MLLEGHETKQSQGNKRGPEGAVIAAMWLSDFMSMNLEFIQTHLLAVRNTAHRSRPTSGCVSKSNIAAIAAASPPLAEAAAPPLLVLLPLLHASPLWLAAICAAMPALLVACCRCGQPAVLRRAASSARLAADGKLLFQVATSSGGNGA